MLGITNKQELTPQILLSISNNSTNANNQDKILS